MPNHWSEEDIRKIQIIYTYYPVKDVLEMVQLNMPYKDVRNYDTIYHITKFYHIRHGFDFDKSTSDKDKYQKRMNFIIEKINEFAKSSERTYIQLDELNRSQIIPFIVTQEDYDSAIEHCKILEYKEPNIESKSIEHNNDGTQISEIKFQIVDAECLKDTNFVLKIHGYDPTCWKIVSSKHTMWDSPIKGGEGVVKLYSSKIKVKPSFEGSWDIETIDKLFRDIKSSKPFIKKYTKEYIQGDNILILPIADLHYGQITNKEVSTMEYNTEIAKTMFYNIIYDTVSRIDSKNIEEIIFVIGNDFINIDNLNNTTTRGTPQDAHGFWYTFVKDVTEMIVNGIEILKEHGNVNVLYIPSNHDLQTMYGIINAVALRFYNDPLVKIDTSPLYRKYFVFGNNLFCFSHNMETKTALSTITTEAKEHWSNSKHVYCILAHLHSESVLQQQGILQIMRLPTTAGTSRWANSCGYVSSDRKNQAFIVNYDKGITDIMYTIDYWN